MATAFVVIPLADDLIHALVDVEDYERVIEAGPWHVKSDGRTTYAHRNVRRSDDAWTTQTLHVFIAGAKRIDHLNGDGLDNRRANLRQATPSQNAANAAVRADSTSGFKGVGWHEIRKRWRARVMCNGKSRSLGYFDNPEEAARAYDSAARELFGEFARLNFPEEIH